MLSHYHVQIAIGKVPFKEKPAYQMGRCLNFSGFENGFGKASCLLIIRQARLPKLLG